MCDEIISEESFAYDVAGNLTGAPSSSFVYDTNNRLTTFNCFPITYDADGNMICNTAMAFEYDSANRLINAGGQKYTYNAEDVRICKYDGTTNTKYLYDTNCRLSRLLMKTTNGVVTKYLYGVDLIGEQTSNGFKTYHYDNRGSVVAMVDAYGIVTDTFEYDTYGKVTQHIGSSDTIFRYNGRDGVVTDENGLIYMRARYYSPAMRRFINADIIPGELSNAITLNRYAYANGNPVSNVDPFGLSAERGQKKLPYYLFDSELLSAQNVAWYTRLKAVFSEHEVLQKIYENEEHIINAANQFNLPSNMIRAVLYRELMCLGYEDYVADNWVLNNYTAFPVTSYSIKRKDSSTGIAQIFAKTAIKSEKNYFGENTTEDVFTMWQKLQDDKTNIYYCALVLASEAKSLGYDTISKNDYEKMKNVFTKYNGSEEYGEYVLENYKQFQKNDELFYNTVYI